MSTVTFTTEEPNTYFQTQTSSLCEGPLLSSSVREHQQRSWLWLWVMSLSTHVARCCSDSSLSSPLVWRLHPSSISTALLPLSANHCHGGLYFPWAGIVQNTAGHLTCPPSCRLIPNQTNGLLWPPSPPPPPLLFPQRLQAGQTQSSGLYWRYTRIQTKTSSLSTLSLLPEREDQYIVKQRSLPEKQEYVNFCFTPSVFGKNFKWRIHQTENRALWSESECNEVTLH